MPSAGFVIAAGVRADGSAGHGLALTRPWLVVGRPRLSHATIAFTRGSCWPTYDTPAAPNEWPAIPIRDGSTSFQNGLNAAFFPSFTRRSCLGAWLVPDSQLFRGAKGWAGVERKKSS